MSGELNLHIDRLVVDSEVLDGADPQALAQLVRAELQGLLETRGLPAGLDAGGTRDAVRGATLAGTGALGAQIAGAVHAGLAATAARSAGERP